MKGRWEIARLPFDHAPAQNAHKVHIAMDVLNDIQLHPHPLRESYVHTRIWMYKCRSGDVRLHIAVPIRSTSSGTWAEGDNENPQCRIRRAGSPWARRHAAPKEKHLHSAQLMACQDASQHRDSTAQKGSVQGIFISRCLCRPPPTHPPETAISTCSKIALLPFPKGKIPQGPQRHERPAGKGKCK